MFVYDWSCSVSEGESIIRLFGLTEQNETVILNVNDFEPYFYLQLPMTMEWTKDTIRLLVDGIRDEMGKGCMMSTITKVKKRKRTLLYYVQETPSLFLQLYFNTNDDFRRLSTMLGPKFKCDALGYVPLKVHEHNATPILQLATNRHLPMTGWITFEGERMNTRNLCHAEYTASWATLSPLTEERGTPTPTILSFDLEVYSSNPNKMPNPKCRADAIFQISCIFWKQGDEVHDKYLLSLGTPDEQIVGEDVTTLTFVDEVALLIGFVRLLIDKNPHVITGYNILGFDMPYIMDRVQKLGQEEYISDNGYEYESLEDYVYTLGMIQGKRCAEVSSSWSSSAYGAQNFRYIAADGRIYIDLLVLARREFKLSNYKLDTVASHFIKANKDPITAADIFRGYEEIGTGEHRLLSEVGHYCVVDSVLVAQLFEVFDTWFGVMEMAAVCHTPASYVYTKGQQVKVFSQVYKYCFDHNIVVEHDGYIPSENEEYQGAHVIEPEPGMYNYVLPYDFASLYPTVMIAYNIDYSTLLSPGQSLPPSRYNLIEWTDEESGHSFSYRFVKEPLGVLPSIAKHLLDARRRTRGILREMKSALPSITDPEEKKRHQIRMNILNKRQLSYKVNCNSLYGSLGVKRGYLPFMPGAMCITAMGRYSLNTAATFLQKECNAELVYGDSVTDDSLIRLRIGHRYRHCTVGEFDRFLSTHYEWRPDYHGNKEYIDLSYTNYSILSHPTFTKLLRIIRHCTSKRIYQIDTKWSSVKVTQDHSLLDALETPIRPQDVVVGQTRLLTVQKDFPEVVTKLTCLGTTEEYVYDFTTVNHMFHAGDGNLVVHNTDSCYVRFPDVPTDRLWVHARQIETFIHESNLFPPPMKLEFEEAIYNPFLILSKKRYMYKDFNEDGTHGTEIGKKGVLLARRDNSAFVRNIYEHAVDTLFQQLPLQETLYQLITILNKCCSGALPYTDFIITKSVKSVSEYKVKPLPTDPKKRAKRLADLRCTSEKDYPLRCVPAQVQLAERMKARGIRVDPGQRIEYLVTTNRGLKAKLFDKIEDPEYQQRHSSILKIDYLYYVHMCIIPIDQLLEIVFKTDKAYTKEQYKLRVRKHDLLRELKHYVSSPLHFE